MWRVSIVERTKDRNTYTRARTRVRPRVVRVHEHRRSNNGTVTRLPFFRDNRWRGREREGEKEALPPFGPAPAARLKRTIASLFTIWAVYSPRSSFHSPVLLPPRASRHIFFPLSFSLFLYLLYGHLTLDHARVLSAIYLDPRGGGHRKSQGTAHTTPFPSAM